MIQVRVRKGFLKKEMDDSIEIWWKNKEKRSCEREQDVQRHLGVKFSSPCVAGESTLSLSSRAHL